VDDVLMIDVAGLRIYGRPDGITVTRGLYLGPDGFKGWTSGVGTRRDQAARQGHGSFRAPGRRESRTVTLTGMGIAPTEQETAALGRKLTGILAEGEYGRVTVETAAGVQYADGTLAGEVLFEHRGRTPRIADWQLQLWFPDPRKYGEERSFPSAGNEQTQIWHRGNFGAAPVHVISGTGPGYTLNGPDGKRFTVREPVSTDSPHLVDMATGQVIIRGNARYGIVAEADVWTVAPGRTVPVRLVPAGGSLSMVTRVKDTYIGG